MFRRRFDATFYRMHVAEAHGRVVGFVDVGMRNGALGTAMRSSTLFTS